MKEKQPLNTSQRMVVILMDVLLLVELVVCMHWSSQNQETMVTNFLKTYLPIGLVTLVSARFAIKRLASPVQETLLHKEAL
jgi:uncharacterized membrane protein YciS (DUF1049 family)